MSKPSYTTPSDGAYELGLAHDRAFPHEAFAMEAANPSPETAAYRRGVEDACEAGGELARGSDTAANDAERALSWAHDAKEVLERTLDAVDGTFPDWRKVVPGGGYKPAPAHFRNRYVGEFGQAAMIAAGNKEEGAAKIVPNGQNPALVLFPPQLEMLGGAHAAAREHG